MKAKKDQFQVVRYNPFSPAEKADINEGFFKRHFSICMKCACCVTNLRSHFYAHIAEGCNANELHDYDFWAKNKLHQLALNPTIRYEEIGKAVRANDTDRIVDLFVQRGVTVIDDLEDLSKEGVKFMVGDQILRKNVPSGGPTRWRVPLIEQKDAKGKIVKAEQTEPSQQYIDWWKKRVMPLLEGFDGEKKAGLKLKPGRKRKIIVEDEEESGEKQDEIVQSRKQAKERKRGRIVEDEESGEEGNVEEKSRRRSGREKKKIREMMQNLKKVDAQQNDGASGQRKRPKRTQNKMVNTKKNAEHVSNSQEDEDDLTLAEYDGEMGTLFSALSKFEIPRPELIPICFVHPKVSLRKLIIEKLFPVSSDLASNGFYIEKKNKRIKGQQVRISLPDNDFLFAEMRFKDRKLMDYLCTENKEVWLVRAFYAQVAIAILGPAPQKNQNKFDISTEDLTLCTKKLCECVLLLIQGAVGDIKDFYADKQDHKQNLLDGTPTKLYWPELMFLARALETNVIIKIISGDASLHCQIPANYDDRRKKREEKDFKEQGGDGAGGWLPTIGLIVSKDKQPYINIVRQFD